MCLNTFIFASWAVPCQPNKCCCKTRSKYDHKVTCNVNFKPYGDDKLAKMKIIQDYQMLKEGTYKTNRTRGCCAWIGRIWRKIWFIFWIVLLFPLYFLALSIGLIIYGIQQIYHIIKGFIVLYCCCNFLCFKEYDYHGPSIEKVDNWSFMTFKASEIERRRFDFYKVPIYIKSLLTQVYLRLCQYLSGLFTAKLMSDDMIIYWIHLWSTTYSKFVYEYDPTTNQPIRVKGIIDDYSMWSSNKSVSEFFDNQTFEILTVFIDYDDDCRITFNLRNGEKITEPRFHKGKWDGNVDNLTEEQLDEIRVWNIVKAHYQCQLSIYPALIHTWTHFHFNDLTLQYIEQHWNDNLYDDNCNDGSCPEHTVMNRLIRSHTYYTSALNAAGQRGAWQNPQMDEWNLCQFIFAPWKVLPAKTSVIRRHFVEDTTFHYFKDIRDINGNDEEEYDRFKCLMDNDSDDGSIELNIGDIDSISPKSREIKGSGGKGVKFSDEQSGNLQHNKEKHVSFGDRSKGNKKLSLASQKSDRSYLSRHSHHFDLKFRKPPLAKCRTNSATTESEYSSNGGVGVGTGRVYQPQMIKVKTDSTASPYHSPSLKPMNYSTPPPRMMGGNNNNNNSKFNITPFNGPISPQMLMQQHNLNRQDLKLKSQSYSVDTPPINNSILLMNEFSLNADINEEEVQQKTHSASNTMVFKSNGGHSSHFIDPTHAVPTIPHDIEVTTSTPPDDGGEYKRANNRDSPQLGEKVANPDAFPPNFVRYRLEMFHLEFPTGSKWIEMHRGYSIYKDYLADYYKVIHEEFVLPLFRNNFITNKDLTIWIVWLEENGWPGLTDCKRNGGYLHILTTFLWLNVAHSSDHEIGSNMIQDFGIGSSYVPFRQLSWYKDNKSYNFIDILEGKNCLSRWRLQFYAMKNRLFWYAFGAPQPNSCFVADYFIDSNLYRRFIDVDNISHKQRHDLNKIHKQFQKQLKVLDVCYRWLMPLDQITAGVSY